MPINRVSYLDQPLKITEHKWPEGTNPVVSISCVAYNQEKFIRDAIEGFLMQETTFLVEINIHDDASTDNTAKIIREYEEKYPQVQFNPIYQTENQYSKRDGTIRRIQYGRVKGKYYSICEGDDFWTDPLKLQKQVDFMEQNEDYSLVHTDHSYKDEETGQLIKARWNNSGRVYQEEENCAPLILSDEYDITTCTALVRTKLVKKILKEYPHDFSEKYIIGDNQVWFHLARMGKIKFMTEVTATYRRHLGGATAVYKLEKRFQFIKGVYCQRRSFAERYNYTNKIPVIDKIYLKSLSLVEFRINNKWRNEYIQKFKKLDNTNWIDLLKVRFLMIKSLLNLK